MDQDRQAERLYRIATHCRDMTGPLRQLSQELGRLETAGSEELVATYKQAVEAILGLERAALEGLVAGYPSHLMTDLAPREIEAIPRRRRELFSALSRRRLI